MIHSPSNFRTHYDYSLHFEEFKKDLNHLGHRKWYAYLSVDYRGRLVERWVISLRALWDWIFRKPTLTLSLALENFVDYANKQTNLSKEEVTQLGNIARRSRLFPTHISFENFEPINSADKLLRKIAKCIYAIQKRVWSPETTEASITDEALPPLATPSHHTPQQDQLVTHEGTLKKATEELTLICNHLFALIKSGVDNYNNIFSCLCLPELRPDTRSMLEKELLPKERKIAWMYAKASDHLNDFLGEHQALVVPLLQSLKAKTTELPFFTTNSHLQKICNGFSELLAHSQDQDADQFAIFQKEFIGKIEGLGSHFENILDDAHSQSENSLPQSEASSNPSSIATPSHHKPQIDTATVSASIEATRLNEEQDQPATNEVALKKATEKFTLICNHLFSLIKSGVDNYNNIISCLDSAKLHPDIRPMLEKELLPKERGIAWTYAAISDHLNDFLEEHQTLVTPLLQFLQAKASKFSFFIANSRLQKISEGFSELIAQSQGEDHNAEQFAIFQKILQEKLKVWAQNLKI